MKLRAALLWALCLCACDGGTKSAPASEPVPQRSELPVEPPPPATREISDPLPTAAAQPAAEDARRLRYRVVTAPAPASSAIAGVGELLAIGAAGAVIDLEDGTRVTAEPNSQLFALGFVRSLLLISGQLHLIRLPDAERAAATPARVSSLAGALEMSPGADLVLRAEPQNTGKQGTSYRAQLGLSRGTVEWFALDDFGVHKHLPLNAGSPLPKPAAGLQWWSSDAQAKPFQALQRVTLRSEDLDRALERALRDQEALRERGHVLLARVSPRHAALAKTPADAPRVESTTREYQRELVEHARRQQTQVSQLLLAAERSLLAALVGCGAKPNATCASLQSWSERFAARVSELL